MTLAAANDIIIRPAHEHDGNGNGDLIGSGNSVLGLVANNFVRVYHPCPRRSTPLHEQRPHRRRDPLARCTRSRPTTTTAARSSGHLTVNGAIAQKYRGAVGTSRHGGSGFIKDYNYDDRLRYRSPPYFLEPIAASWHVIRSNEQVPPR